MSNLVGMTGLEPAASTTRTWRSSRLSYIPTNDLNDRIIRKHFLKIKRCVIFFSDMVIFFVFLFLLLASAAYASWRGAPWAPTWKRDLLRIEKLAQLKEGDRFVELGCGTGRVCRYLAKRTSAKTFGVELSFLQWAYASLFSFLGSFHASGFQVELGRDGKKAQIIFGDVFHHDLSTYSVVYMFLMPKTYEKIRDKLACELSCGARMITYVWPIPGWIPSYVDRVDGSPDLYLYEKQKTLEPAPPTGGTDPSAGSL